MSAIVPTRDEATDLRRRHPEVFHRPLLKRLMAPFAALKNWESRCR